LSEQTIRIGFIGAGGIARQRHLPNLKKIPGIELVAVANRTLASAQRVAADFGFKRATDDWHELLAMPDIDAVFITAPPYLHAPATLAALDLDKHVFCQARMAMNYEQAKAMYLASLRTDRRTMLSPPPHAMLGDYLVRKWIREGYFGSIYEIHVHSLSAPYADPDSPLHWRQDAAISGLNVLNLGMLVEVLHRWVGYFSRVSAHLRTHIPKRPMVGVGHLVPVTVPDSVAIIAEQDSEPGKGGCSQAVMHFSGVTRFGGENRIEIYGSEASMIYYVDSHRILAARKGDRELAPVEIPPDLRRQWTAEADFIRAIREGTPVEPSFWDGLKYMEFTEAVYRSAGRDGCAVFLPFEELPRPA